MPKPKRKFEEDELNASAVQYLSAQYPNALFFHPANEGKRTKYECFKFKRLGGLAGVSDLAIMEPTHDYHGLFIEFKSVKGRVTDTQKTFMKNARERGYRVEVIRTLDAFIALIDEYMDEILLYA